MRRAGRAGCLVVAILVAAAAFAAPAGAAQPRTSLPELEGEVMCPVCGTLLSLSQSPAAMRERAFIRKLIAQGRNEEEIKDALVAEYGPRVLAEPEGSGFDLSAYLVPIVGFALAAFGILLAVLRWRRSRPEREGPPGTGSRPPDDEQSRRIERDMARYDL